jgi:hypothetical protein
MHIEVLYHNEEAHGDRHKCQWNKANQQCECMCAQTGKPAADHDHWGAAKDEVHAFFDQIHSSLMKAVGGGGLHGAGHGSTQSVNILPGQAPPEWHSEHSEPSDELLM